MRGLTPNAATAMILQIDRVANTDSMGTFDFRDVRVGRYTLKLLCARHYSKIMEANFSIALPETVVVDLGLISPTDSIFLRNNFKNRYRR
jgi:hypothetical protein